MAIIGTFTRGTDGKLSGALKTLTLTSKLQFAPEANKPSEKAPDLRIFFGTVDYAESGILRSVGL